MELSQQVRGEVVVAGTAAENGEEVAGGTTVLDRSLRQNVVGGSGGNAEVPSQAG